MADEKETRESAQEQSENEDSPSPAVPSVVSGEKQPSGSRIDAELFVSALSDPRVKAAAVEALRPEWEKDDQRVKDKRIQGLTDDVARLKQYVNAAGGDVDRAIREMQIDDILEGRASPARGSAGGNESSQAFMEARTAQLLSGAGIDFDDPDYKMLVAQYGGRVTDPNQWIGVVEGFVGSRQSKKAKQENIPPAAAASESGNVLGVEGDEDIESLTEQLNKLRAQRATPATMEQRTQIRKKLTALQDRMRLLENVRFTRE